MGNTCVKCNLCVFNFNGNSTNSEAMGGDEVETRVAVKGGDRGGGFGGEVFGGGDGGGVRGGEEEGEVAGAEEIGGVGEVSGGEVGLCEEGHAEAL